MADYSYSSSLHLPGFQSNLLLSEACWPTRCSGELIPRFSRSLFPNNLRVLIKILKILILIIWESGLDNRRVPALRAGGEEEPEDLLRLERAGGRPAFLPEGDLPPLISSDQVGLGQVKLARFPLMTGTRGLPYRTIPGALYNFFLGRLADGLVSIM